MKISCVNLPLLDWSLSSILLVDIWLPVAHPGEAEGRSQSQAVGVGGRWDSSLQISTLFTCFLNDRTVGQTNEELSHRKLLWMCLFCVFSEWLYPLQYAYMKSSWLTTVLFISFQSAPERDQRAGDPVPDRALLQGERWGTGSQSMSTGLFFLSFPFLQHLNHQISIWSGFSPGDQREQSPEEKEPDVDATHRWTTWKPAWCDLWPCG